MRKDIFVAIMLAAIAPLLAQSQKPNLSGSWRLNVAKSYMGQEHPFIDYQLTKKIELTGDTLSITDTAIHNSNVNIPLPDSTTTMQVAADGKEHEVQMQSGNRRQRASVAKVTAAWQGGTLELVQVVTGLANMSKQRLFLSDDGSQLIDLVENHNVYGDGEQRLVLDKLP